MRNVQLIRKERKRLKIAASAESEIMVNPESASRQAA
jgi:hypothetical protein